MVKNPPAYASLWEVECLQCPPHLCLSYWCPLRQKKARVTPPLPCWQADGQPTEPGQARQHPGWSLPHCHSKEGRSRCCRQAADVPGTSAMGVKELGVSN